MPLSVWAGCALELTMINFRHYGPAGTMLEEITALFQKQWQVYRKVVDNN
jgi:hypothetical protein